MREMFQKRLLPALAGVVVLLLLVKYFWSLILFPEVPFGYDAGIYRYLFIRHSAGIPPFDTGAVPPWAQAHAPALFFLSSILMHLGITADMLIGWIWNLVPALLALTLGAVVRKKYGDLPGLFVLLAALVSTVQYQGFLMMYQKTFVAMMFCALAFAAFEKRSVLWIVFGMFTIALHQQIGLIFVVSIASAMVSSLVLRQEPVSRRRVAEFLLTMALGVVWYIPTYQHSLTDIAPKLLESGTIAAFAVAILVIGGFSGLVVWLPQKNRRLLWFLAACTCVVLLCLLPIAIDSPGIVGKLLASRPDTAGGAFLSLTEYVQLSLPLLLAGIAGFMLSLERERGSAWQWAVLWCAVASLGMFFFYRRFLLPLDFFLLPFAALAFAALWNQKKAGRIVLSVLVIAQAVLLLQRMAVIDPAVKPEWIREFATLHTFVPAGSTVVVMDNMAPWVLGFLPDAAVSGPGIFDSLPLSEWEKFLLGTDMDRATFFGKYPRGTFFFVSDVFRGYYPHEVQSVLMHPCLEKMPTRGLYRSVCGA